MELVNTKHVLIIFAVTLVLILPLLYWGLYTPVQIIEGNGDEGTPGGAFEDIPNFPSANEQEVQSTQVERLEPITINTIGVLLALIMSFLVYSSYRWIINSSDVRRFVNTQLRLAGFQYNIPAIGREWEISGQITINLVTRNSQVEFVIQMTISEELEEATPAMFGFQSEGSVVTTRTEPEALQLSLQSLRRMIISSSS